MPETEVIPARFRTDECETREAQAETRGAGTKLAGISEQHGMGETLAPQPCCSPEHAIRAGLGEHDPLR
jgi:hypothetical protein